MRFDNLGEGKGLIDAGFEVARGETIEDVLLRFGRRSGVGDHFEKGVAANGEAFAQGREERKGCRAGGEGPVLEDRAAERSRSG